MSDWGQDWILRSNHVRLARALGIRKMPCTRLPA